MRRTWGVGKVDAIGGSGRVHTSDIPSCSPLAFQGFKVEKNFLKKAIIERKAKKMLNIIKTVNGNNITLILQGRVDTTTAVQLDAAYEELMGMEEVEINMEELQYISSAGLRVLLKIEKKMRASSGKLILKKVPEEIMEVFEMTGFADILTME